ncbi:hypothetical protein [Wohlfahrtiimonas chitiniclastica]|uniref:hypothetical protein n=1 Tax=Wohlfahrtiimonas chitiniclastica TaxID=400946 RepID=UPI0015C648BB|nr:hypothetical protein [Wohlfahrtiimonas chitiniclastica]
MSKNKKISLRAFRINNTKISISNDTYASLDKRLNSSSSSADRCMILNQEDPNKERDVLSNFSKSCIPQSYFCTMLRLIPGEDAKHITEDLLKLPKFSIEDIDKNSIDTPNICKEHFYFSISNQYLVTNLRGNKSIKDLQTFLAWFLNNDLFELTPMVNIPKDIPLSDIKNITFNDSFRPSYSEAVEDNVTSSTKKINLLNQAADLIRKLLVDTKSLDQIDLEEIISADLVIKLNKPKKMTKEKYEKVMGALIKPVSDIDGISISPLKGRSIIKGKDIPRTKDVTISMTKSGKLIEPELQQQMSKFINELIDDE